MREKGLVHFAWFDLSTRQYGPLGSSGLRENLTKEEVIETYTKLFKERFEHIEFIAIDFNEGFRKGVRLGGKGFYLFYKETPETAPYLIMNNGAIYPRDFLDRNVR